MGRADRRSGHRGRGGGGCASRGEGLEPPSDVHASGSYRREMAAVMAKRALLSAIDQLTDGHEAAGKEEGA